MKIKVKSVVDQMEGTSTVNIEIDVTMLEMEQMAVHTEMKGVWSALSSALERTFSETAKIVQVT